MALPELAASSPLAESRELNAHLRAPAIVGINLRGELGGSAFAASLFQAFLHSSWTVSSFPVSYGAPWDPSMRLAPNVTPEPLSHRASALPSVETRGGKAGHLNWWLGCHSYIFPACCNTAPKSSARSQDLLGIWVEGPASGIPMTSSVFLFHLNHRLFWPGRGVSATGCHWLAGTVHAPSLPASPALSCRFEVAVMK